MPKATAKNPLLRRKSSSPFSSLQRTKPNIGKSSLATEDRLEDSGLIPSLAPKAVGQDVMSLVEYVKGIAFDDIPDRASGMDSERTSEVLRFRRALPSIVSLAQLHALSRSSTTTEREIASLVADGKLRKISIPGRGRGGTAVGDGVVVVSDWVAAVNVESSISDSVRETYISLLSTHRTSPTTPITSLSAVEERGLVVAGLLTSPGALTSSLSDLFAPPSLVRSSSSISAAGHTNPTGSMAAIGGAGAVHASGGGGSLLATSSGRLTRPPGHEMTFALPGTGAYLKLLVAARAHFLHLLKALSPKYKEATLDVLKERWEGNVPGDAISRLKRERGEWSGVLPGKTKKWREFYGLRFEYVLAEAVGSGIVEVFETGSVGLAVRGR
ncbi:hypothetical protein B0A48_07093 [Cryoendolithus antarcticus]|uniref:Serine-threonine protein kinase 19 n=1 Tax=Cryoendolithus antarcticus TaxID=1507870 RepID=A0A1V8T7K6_9PEZI|nr:hypothetical protein B0A48_07093 [Cryoendolithus antarcticus]